jgi:hypothetical protein
MPGAIQLVLRTPRRKMDRRGAGVDAAIVVEAGDGLDAAVAEAGDGLDAPGPFGRQ